MNNNNRHRIKNKLHAMWIWIGTLFSLSIIVCGLVYTIACVWVLLWQTIYIFKIIASKRTKVAARVVVWCVVGVILFFSLFFLLLFRFLGEHTISLVVCWMYARALYSVEFNFTLGGIIIYILVRVFMAMCEECVEQHVWVYGDQNNNEQQKHTKQIHSNEKLYKTNAKQPRHKQQWYYCLRKEEVETLTPVRKLYCELICYVTFLLCSFIATSSTKHINKLHL